MLTDRRAVPLLVAAIAAWSLVLTSHTTAQEAVTLDELAKVRSVEASRIAAIEKVYNSVVAIYGLSRQGGGSGVIYDPAGYALTNYHVTSGAGVEGWGGLADGKLYKWKLVGHDPGGDVAIIKLEGPTPDHQFPYADLADSDTVRVGDFAMAMGNPFILAEDQTPTVTLGIVSGVKRYQAGTGPGGKMLEYGNCIQVDSSINPGNSGGPLFNMKGQVIGINGRGSFEERGRVNVGLGYAISANQCKMFIPELLAAKTCEHGTLEAVFNRRGNNEVVCESINLDSPLAKAGFELGDRLLKFNGQEMKTTHEFTNTIATLPAHWPVEVVWDHEGKTKSAWVRLTPILYPKPPAPPQPRPTPRPTPTPPKPEEKGKEKTPEKSPEKKPDEKQPATPPKPVKPAPAGEEKTDDGFTIEELTQKLKRLEDVRAAVKDNPEALKEVGNRINEVKAKIEELKEKKEPAKPEDKSSAKARLKELTALLEQRDVLSAQLDEWLIAGGRSRKSSKGSKEEAELVSRLKAVKAQLVSTLAEAEANGDLEAPVDTAQTDAVEALIQKREQLRVMEKAMFVAGRENHPAQKDLRRRISEITHEITAQVDAESKDKPTEPAKEPAKEQPKDAPKVEPKDTPKPPTPAPPTPPKPIIAAPPQASMEFGKIMNASINEREALRIVAQYQSFLGGRETLDQVKAIRTVGETRQGDKVTSTATTLVASDGRSRIESNEAGEGDAKAVKSLAIWDGSRFTRRADNQTTVIEGDQARRNPAVAMNALQAGLIAAKPKDHFKRIVLQGTDLTQGWVASRILFEDKAGNRMIAWFSLMNRPGFSADSLETRLLKIAFADDKDQPRDPAITVENYNAVKGAQVSQRSRMVTGLNEATLIDIVVTRVELLRELPAGAFEMEK